MAEFEELNRNQVLEYLESLTIKISNSGSDEQWPRLKRQLVKEYGSNQMNTFYESLKTIPRSTFGDKNPSEATRYMRPSDESMAEAAAKAKKIEKQKAIDFVQSFQEKNKGGVVTKKTKGFKHGGLAGTGHNDMRKGGLFK